MAVEHDLTLKQPTPSQASGSQVGSYIDGQRDESLGLMLNVIFIGSLAILFYALLFIDEGFNFALVAGLLLIVGHRISLILHRRNYYRGAVAVLLVTGIVLMSVSVLLIPLNENRLLFFAPVLVGLAALLLRPIEGVLVATLSQFVPVVTAMLTGQTETVLSAHFLAAVALAYLSALVMWLIAQNLVAATEWAIDSYHKVEKRETQLFASEQRLQRALAEREGLNHQLVVSNRQLEEARQSAEEANRLKSQFLHTMSHELRTPLNAIIGLSYILRQQIRGELNSDQADYVERIYGSGNHLLQLLNDILDHAKLEAGRVELHLISLDIHPVIDDVLQTATTLVRDKPIKLETQLAPNVPLVRADRLRLTQVLLNLLSNSVKFTEQGSITIRAYPRKHPEAKPGAEALPDVVMIEVSDTGIGIDPQYFSLIFEEFRQVDEGRSRRFGGTGLGLPISRRLVELHSGRLSVTSQPGVGSTFRFYMPVSNEPATTKMITGEYQLTRF
jgi:signal transduction histidine kinase